MDWKTIDLNNTNIAVPKEKLLEDLRMVVSDAEELLRVTAKNAGIGVVAVRGRIQENLQVVKNSMVAAETDMIERTRNAEKVTAQHVRYNVRYWY